MPFDLLSKFAYVSLPINVKETEEINAVLALSAAGLITAEIPRVVRSLRGLCYEGVAVVTSVTSEGHAVLEKRLQYPKQI
ncbi:MAG: hypothetical protein EOO88_36290 [Pedobacter sp.]|nr:MAG: hypothetical protein EOO88_36290 [Pedobacter sp.]